MDESAKRKTFVAPSGKKCRTWKEAEKLMDDAEDCKEGLPFVEAFC